MLGLARAAQYAGWGQIAPSFASQSTTRVQAYSAWADGASVPTNLWTSPNGADITPVFDATGVTAGNRAVYAATYRLKTAGNYTFLTDAVDSNYNYLAPFGTGTFTQYTPFFVYINDATMTDRAVINPKLGRHGASGDLAFLVDWGSYNWVRVTGVPWDSIADRFISVVFAVSQTQSDFANYSNSDFGNTYGRMTIADATTGELIFTRDFRTNQFLSVITDWPDRTIRYRNISGDSATAWFYSQIRTGTDLSGDDVLTAAGWAAPGAVLDPTADYLGQPVWRSFVGQQFPETVAGVRAWVNFTATAATTNPDDSDLVDLFEMAPGRVTTSRNRFSTEGSDIITVPYINSAKP